MKETRLDITQSTTLFIQRTLVFGDVKVETQHHGNLFGLLLMKCVIQHVVFMGMLILLWEGGDVCVLQLCQTV